MSTLKRLMRSVIAVLCLALLSACHSSGNGLVLGSGAGAGNANRELLSHSGRWLTDAQGRVVFLHGVNMISKFPPYQPAALGFDQDDLAYLAGQGFNSIRLGFIWKGYEPEPGQYNEAYLDSLFKTAQQASDAGLWVLFDFHQDMWNERYNGEGAPDWAAVDDGLPALPDIGFPGNYFVMLAMWRAYDHFLANDAGKDGRPMVDAFAAAWHRVALRMRGVTRLQGYDIWNEPFPGSSLAACANPLGCVDDADARLSRVEKQTAQAIRAADPDHLIYYEPFLTFNDGADTKITGIDDPNAGMSFHVYCLANTPGLPAVPGTSALCGLAEQLVFTNADQHSAATRDTAMVTEFGATDDLSVLERVANLADTNLMSWQYWAWWNHDVCCARPNEGIIRDIGQPPTPDNLKQDKLDVLVRPYPLAVAGTPTAFGFDRSSKTFHLDYSTERVDGAGRFSESALTVVYVPVRQYPNGYQVQLSGAEVTSAPNATLLNLRALPGAQQVALTLTATAQ